MEKTKQGICVTCHYRKGCSIKTSAAASWECSEYRISTVFSSQRMAYLPASVSRSDIKGLCNSCESISTCQWVHPDMVKFHCEHYQ